MMEPPGSLAFATPRGGSGSGPAKPVPRPAREGAIRVSVVINNRDLLTWPRRMVERLERMPGLAEIVIVDNGSSYRPLLAWYRTIPHRVEFCDNLGHTAPWDSGVIDTLASDLVVVTDPDLNLDALPDDTLLHLAGLLGRHPGLGKIGLSLVTDGIPEASPYRAHVERHERLPQTRTTGPEGLIEMPVDTTFAIHDRRVLDAYRIGGMRTPAPYQARHEPWHVVRPEGDFAYYLDHAEGRSSSYRDFTRHVRSDSLRALHTAHPGRRAARHETTLDVLEEQLRPLKREALDLLELDAGDGGTLEIWARYFPRARALVGCGGGAAAAMPFDDPRIALLAGPAGVAETFRAVVERTPQGLDLVVASGARPASEVLTAFLSYFPRVKPGGFYVVERLHGGYDEAAGGGVLNERSSIAFFRRLFDAVHAEHLGAGLDAGSLFQAFVPRATMNAFLAANPVLGFAVHDGVLVVRKAAPARPRALGREIVVGEAVSGPAPARAPLAQAA